MDWPRAGVQRKRKCRPKSHRGAAEKAPEDARGGCQNTGGRLSLWLEWGSAYGSVLRNTSSRAGLGGWVFMAECSSGLRQEERPEVQLSFQNTKTEQNCYCKQLCFRNSWPFQGFETQYRNIQRMCIYTIRTLLQVPSGYKTHCQNLREDRRFLFLAMY